MNQSILQSAIIGLPVENNNLQEDPISINIVVPKIEIKEETKLEIIELKKPQKQEKKQTIITIPKKQEPEPIKNPELNKVIIDPKSCDSIIEDVETGFGPEQTITIPDCPKKKHFTHLYKENYLGEFKEESEKALARYNLGVYSKAEIDEVVSKIVQENDNFVTKSQVEGMLQELDFVDSVLKSYADYQIPSDLFKL